MSDSDPATTFFAWVVGTAMLVGALTIAYFAGFSSAHSPRRPECRDYATELWRDNLNTHRIYRCDDPRQHADLSNGIGNPWLTCTCPK